MILSSLAECATYIDANYLLDYRVMEKEKEVQGPYCPHQTQTGF